jgi:hypothetical protein
LEKSFNYKHALPPVPAISEISTCSVSICYHRELLNYYRKSRNITSSKNTQILMVFTVLMFYWFQFAKYGPYLIVFMYVFFMLASRR